MLAAYLEATLTSNPSHIFPISVWGETSLLRLASSSSTPKVGAAGARTNDAPAASRHDLSDQAAYELARSRRIINLCPSGGAISLEGVCCGSQERPDVFGACCGSTVDACGVCGGAGVAVDALNRCCDTTLDAQGLCCSSAVDECGVCGGGSACDIVGKVALRIVNRAPNSGTSGSHGSSSSSHGTRRELKREDPAQHLLESPTQQPPERQLSVADAQFAAKNVEAERDNKMSAGVPPHSDFQAAGRLTTAVGLEAAPPDELLLQASVPSKQAVSSSNPEATHHNDASQQLPITPPTSLNLHGVSPKSSSQPLIDAATADPTSQSSSPLYEESSAAAAHSVAFKDVSSTPRDASLQTGAPGSSSHARSLADTNTTDVKLSSPPSTARTAVDVPAADEKPIGESAPAADASPLASSVASPSNSASLIPPALSGSETSLITGFVAVGSDEGPTAEIAETAAAAAAAADVVTSAAAATLQSSTFTDQPPCAMAAASWQACSAVGDNLAPLFQRAAAIALKVSRFLLTCQCLKASPYYSLQFHPS